MTSDSILKIISKKLKCYMSKHVISISGLKRREDGRVEATCKRCGKVLVRGSWVRYVW